MTEKRLVKKIKAKFLILGTGNEEEALKEKVKKLKPHNFKNPYVVRASGKNDGYIDETGNT